MSKLLSLYSILYILTPPTLDYQPTFCILYSDSNLRQNHNATMSHKSQRKQRKKQQKQMLQLLQSQSSQPWPRPPPPPPQRQEPEAPPWRRSPSFLKTLETIEEGRQTDFSPRISHQEPQRDYPSPFLTFKLTFAIVSMLLFLGVAIGHAIKPLAPNDAGPILLALQVFVVEMVKFVICLPFHLLLLVYRIVTGAWSFPEYTVMVSLMTLLISYSGTRYILREEYVLLSLSLFCCLSAMLLLGTVC